VDVLVLTVFFIQAYLTSLICGQSIAQDQDIPDNDYFERYGPDFTMEVTKSHVNDQNSKTEIDENIKTIISKSFCWAHAK
jgi:hypothetical protein